MGVVRRKNGKGGWIFGKMKVGNEDEVEIECCSTACFNTFTGEKAE
jgi:hypothetical protein